MKKVALHGAEGNAEQRRDVGSRLAFANQLEDTDLGRRQIIELVERIVRQARRPGG